MSHSKGLGKCQTACLELAVTLQEDCRAFQYEQDFIKQIMLAIKMEAKQFNVKYNLRRQLHQGILNWHLNTHRNEAPITIATFLNMRNRNMIFKEALKKRYLDFEEERIEHYQDLPFGKDLGEASEGLQICFIAPQTSTKVPSYILQF